MADVTPRLHLIAQGAEGGALPSEFIVIAGDDGTDIHPIQVAADGDLKVTLDSEVVDTELPAAVALADNAANPTAPAVGAFAMVWDGVNWDRAPGTSADGLLVNLGGNNDVTISGTVDTELPAAAALTDNFANPTAPGVGAFGMLWDGATWDRAPGNSVDGLLVNLGTNNDVTITGAVDTELPAAAALADDVANPTVPAVGGFLMGFDSGSTNWNRVEVDDAGHLQVDVLSGAGSDAPTNPTVDVASSTNTAAAGSANLDSAEITEAEKLWAVAVSAGVAFKAQVQAVENGTPRNLSNLLFGQAGETVFFELPHRDFATHVGASAGLDVFRAVVTNMDDSQAADLHATFFYST